MALSKLCSIAVRISANQKGEWQREPLSRMNLISLLLLARLNNPESGPLSQAPGGGLFALPNPGFLHDSLTDAENPARKIDVRNRSMYWK